MMKPQEARARPYLDKLAEAGRPLTFRELTGFAKDGIIQRILNKLIASGTVVKEYATEHEGIQSYQVATYRLPSVPPRLTRTNRG